MMSLYASCAPIARCRLLGASLSLLIASCPNWATASEPAEVLVESEADALSAGRIISSDTAALLSGVDSAQAGGVSGLPMIHGLGDDRIRIVVNGVPVAAACPMHMNPPLSYVDPSNVARIEILPSIQLKVGLHRRRPQCRVKPQVQQARQAEQQLARTLRQR